MRSVGRRSSKTERKNGEIAAKKGISDTEKPRHEDLDADEDQNRAARALL